MPLNFYQRSILSLVLHSLSACASAIISFVFFEKTGVSALFVVFLIMTVWLIHRLVDLSLQSLDQAKNVILALANGDNTISLKANHPLKIQFGRAQNIMQKARFTAERKHQFLQSILLHVDLAVLVCDLEGKLLEANPAVSLLIGQRVRHLESLGQLGKRILTMGVSGQFTTPWQRGEETDVLTVSISRVTIQGQVLLLVSLQSIKSELQQQEQQAYKQLTQVITHEVANSVTPLSSLAETCLMLLPEANQPFDDENREDACLALNTIQDRAQHLTHFVEHLKDLNRLPSPKVDSLEMDQFLLKTVKFFEGTCKEKNIDLTYHAHSTLMVMMDAGQIEQVLINLIKNAIEAVELKASQADKSYVKSISLSLGHHNGQQWYIEVQDNGNGILESTANMMFVPFFTTKPEGSGIGLALSRQIMMNHGGDLVFVEKPNGACFRCLFGV